MPSQHLMVNERRQLQAWLDRVRALQAMIQPLSVPSLVNKQNRGPNDEHFRSWQSLFRRDRQRQQIEPPAVVRTEDLHE